MSQKSKVYRGIRRHPWPCYCLYCESDMLSDYLDLKKGKMKYPKQEIQKQIDQ